MSSEKADSESSAMWRAYNEFHFLCDTTRFAKLVTRGELVRMIADVPGDIVDAGAFKGVSTLQFAHFLQIYRPNAHGRVLSCDTFEPSMTRLRAHEQGVADDLMSAYEPSAEGRLRDAIARFGLTHRVTILKGDITATLPRYLGENPGCRIALLHCDLDAYEPTLATLQAAWPRIVPGGVVVFDEYAVGPWGEADAADQFFSKLSQPPRLRTLTTGPSPTAYCVKESY
jgi:predicted O-methyltransferase YrrM